MKGSALPAGGFRSAQPVPADPATVVTNWVTVREIPAVGCVRFADFQRDSADDEAREIDLAFSSEYPVERWFGFEILDHTAGSMRDGFINSGRAHLLLDHDTRSPVGIIVAGSVKIGADRKARARVRFSNSARAKEVYEEARDGFRPNVSVGYRIHRMVLDATGDDGDTYRVIEWEPYEISLVSVPADPSAGVQRGRTPDSPTHKISIVSSEGDDMANGVALAGGNRSADVVPTVPAVPGGGNDNLSPDAVRAAEAKRMQDILTLGRRCNLQSDAERFAFEGKSLAAFQGYIAERAAQRNEASPLRPNTELGMSANEVSRYSLYAALRAAANNDWSAAGLEREASQAVADKLGKPSRGFYLPPDVLSRGFLNNSPANASRAGEMTTSGAGARLVGTDHLSGSFIELLRNRAMVLRLGARVLGGLVGNVDIPRLSGGALTKWVAEGGDAEGSDLNLDHMVMTPKTITAELAMTRRLLLQSSPDAEALSRQDLIDSIALGIDRAALHGSGTSGEPLGIFNIPGVGLVACGANGGPISYTKAVALETAVALANADLGNLAYLTNAHGRGALKTTLVAPGASRFIWEGGQVNGYRAEASNQIRADYTKGTHTTADLWGMAFGNWSDLIIGEWGVLDIEADKATLAKSGGTVLRAFQDIDLGPRHVGSFAVTKDAERVAA